MVLVLVLVLVLLFVSVAPIPMYSRLGSTSGKLVHGRSLAHATRVISHDAHNAALSPVLRVPWPGTSRGTGYTTGTQHGSKVRVIWPASRPCRTQGLFSLSRSTHCRMQCMRSGLSGKRVNREPVSVSIERIERNRGKSAKRQAKQVIGC